MSTTIETLNADELARLTSADESALIELCALEHARALLEHPDFSDWIEDIDPFVCRRADLVDAMRKAPNGLVRQHLYAIWVFRKDVALLTGRSFP